MKILNKYNNISEHLMKSKVIITSLMVLITMSELLAQNINQIENPRFAKISVIARADSDSIVLRWAPGKAGGWVIANQIGYIVERIEISTDTTVDYKNYERITMNPLKPLSLEEWKAKTSTDNMFSAVAAQALYGKLFNPTPMNQGDLNALKNAADDLSNRYSFSLFAADNDAFTAEALGLRLVDKNIEEGKKYAYRVFVAEQTEQYSFDTAYIVVDAVSYKKPAAPQGLSYESSDQSIKLFWTDNLNQYSGYYIYRSDDGGKSFKQLNDMPHITITPRNAYREAQPSYIDTSTVNYTQYIYQLRGVTPFAELSDAAEVKAISKDMEAPLAPKMNKAVQISDTEIKLSWEMQTIPNDLQGFVISRSNNSIDGYHLLNLDPLPQNTREYIADLSDAYEAYYTVASVDTAGNLAFSVPVLATRIDTIQPQVPTGLVGEVDENGIVSLRWNKSKEFNIKGYRVLRANDPTHEFAQVTGYVHSDTIFTDSICINTLTKHIYYRVAAVNDRYQHSEMSDILELERPDMVAPVEAVFSDVFVTDTSVVLKWFPSSSEDLAYQVLMRKKQNEDSWQSLDTMMTNVSSYIDKEIETKVFYEYTIVSVDQSGLSSDLAFPVRARPYDTGKRKAIENFKVEYNTETKLVDLTWEYKPKENERTWYLIYKAIGEGDYKEYKSIEGSKLSFTDNRPITGLSGYGVVVMTSSGGESEMVTSSITIE